MRNIDKYKKWEKTAESKFKIIGDLSCFNSLVFMINEDDFYQIGFDEDNDLFFFSSYIQGVEEVKGSEDASDLNKWLDKINN